MSAYGRWTAMCLWALLAVEGTARASAPPPTEDDFTFDVVDVDGVNEALYRLDATPYCDASDPSRHLIAYMPWTALWSDTKLPVAVLFHGAGGDVSSMEQAAQMLATRGYIGVSVAYRDGGGEPILAALTTGKIGASDPTAMSRSMADARCAVRYVKTWADAGLPVDADRVAIGGHSQGSLVTQGLFLADNGPDEPLCIGDSVQMVSPFRIQLHRGMGQTYYDFVRGCQALTPESWATLEDDIGDTERAHPTVSNTVHAAALYSTSSDVMSIATQCAIMHSLFGSRADGLTVPMPVDEDGQPQCGPYKSPKSAVRAFRPVLNPFDSDQAVTDLFAKSWTQVALDFAGLDDTSLVIDAVEYSELGLPLPAGSEEIMPTEYYFPISMRRAMETLTPLTNLDNVPKIPVLVANGTEDRLTPWTQAASAATILRQHGYAAGFLLYEDANHFWTDAEWYDLGRHTADFLDAAFEIGEDSIETVLNGICDASGKRCLEQVIGTGLHIRNVPSAAHVAPPHNSGVPLSGVGTPFLFFDRPLYTGLTYEFAAENLRVTGTLGHSGYWSNDDDVTWVLRNGAGQQIASCVGPHMTISGAAQQAGSGCDVSVDAGVYSLRAEAADGGSDLQFLSFETHPDDGQIPGLFSLPWAGKEYIYWDEPTGTAIPGGLVEVFLDDDTTPYALGRKSSIEVPGGHTYRVCWAGTAVCETL